MPQTHHSLPRTIRVPAPLSAYLEPDSQTVDVGKEAIFRCRILGFPVDSVRWTRNGRTIQAPGNGGGSGGGGRIALLTKEMLRIESVTSGDKGVYQCHVANELDGAQAAAQLAIGGKQPPMADTITQCDSCAM